MKKKLMGDLLNVHHFTPNIELVRLNRLIIWFSNFKCQNAQNYIQI